MDAFTIADWTTAAQATVIAQSFLAEHPEGTFAVVWLDDTETTPDLRLSDTARIRIIPAASLPEVRDRLIDAALAGATVDQLRAQALPGTIRALASEASTASWVYLDVHTYVLGELTAIEAGLNEAALVFAALSPAAIPDDGKSPTEKDAGRAGGLSSAVFAFRSEEFETLRGTGFGDESAMSLSRWLELLAARVPHTVLRDGTCPASRYSMVPATLSSANNRLRVSERPVQLLDLREFDVVHPWVLSAADERSPRILLSTQPELRKTIADYARRVRAAADRLPRHDNRPAPYTQLANGHPIDNTLRFAYVTGQAAAANCKDVPPPFPFGTVAEADQLLEWLKLPPHGGATRIGRYALAARAQRPDLLALFPAVNARPDADAAFARWITEHGVNESRYNSSVLAACVPEPQLEARRQPISGGINVAGFLRGELGIGVAARASIAALSSAHVPTHHFVASGISSRQEADAPGGATDDLFDTTLLCLNPPETPAALDRLSNVIEGGYVIGQWFWELEEPPDLSAADNINEIWAATTFMRDAYLQTSPVPVTHMPIPLYWEPGKITLGRSDVCAELGVPDEDYLLFAFDHFSTMERKNPLGLIAAFTRAFPHPGDGPQLLIKSINADRRVADAERLRIAAAGRSDITIIENYLSAQQLAALFAHTRCYVSLHRSEGLGLTIAEAMSVGRPTIVTGYSGNMDFTTEENSYLIPWQYTTVPDDAAPYRPGAKWADPDLDGAAALITHVVTHEAEAERRGARAVEDLCRSFSVEACGTAMARRLTDIRRSLDAQRLAELRQERRNAPKQLATRTRRWIGHKISGEQ